ncbi:MAG: MBL fold metallo-hydrolase [Salinibacterium amurskyense]
MVLEIDVHSSDDGALRRMFSENYLPALRRQSGFVDAELIRAFDPSRQAQIEGLATAHSHELRLRFTSEDARLAWVASDDHSAAWNALIAVAVPEGHRAYEVLEAKAANKNGTLAADPATLEAYLRDEQLVRSVPVELRGRDLGSAAADAELVVWIGGSGTPKISHTRSGPSVVCGIGESTVVIDCGNGTPQMLSRLGRNPAQLTHIFITHLHMDHVADLAHLILSPWVMMEERDAPLHIVGPPGTQEFVDRLLSAYDYDVRVRLPHGFDPAALAPRVSEVGDGAEVVVDGVLFTAFSVNHHPVTHALGYRMEVVTRGRTSRVVVSGDTTPTTNLVDYSQGADVLIHEALMPGFGIPSYHTSVDDAADLATACRAKRLVLTHLLPGHLPDEQWLERVRPRFDGDIAVAADGLKVFDTTVFDTTEENK